MRVDYKKEDIVEALYSVGISLGDDVFIHSNIGFFGMLENCKSANDLCEGFIGAIREVIGEEGSIICPTFSYSYCHGEIYNPATTGTTCGMLSEYMIKHYPENRTLDPNFSVCGIGKAFDVYKNCNIHESFGSGSFFELFKNRNGKILCLNFDAGSTFVHYIERANNVDYRYNKAFNGQTEIDGKITKDYAVHFVFEGDDNYPCMERVDDLCRENNICKEVCLGKGTVLASPSKEYFDFFSNVLKTRPRVFCKTENV